MSELEILDSKQTFLFVCFVTSCETAEASVHFRFDRARSSRRDKIHGQWRMIR